MRASRSLLLFGACFWLMGCAASVTVTYTPDPAKKSPLETLVPLTVSLNVEDHRASWERDRVGNSKNSFGNVVDAIRSNEPPTATLKDALAKELANNGIRVQELPAATVQKVIRVQLRKYWVENQVKVLDIAMSATVVADIVVEDLAPRGMTSSHTLTGSAQDSRQFALEYAYEASLNDAVAEFVQSFARNPGVLRALRRTGPSGTVSSSTLDK